MQSKFSARAVSLSALMLCATALSLYAFAAPPDVVFPAGTENCAEFTRGRSYNNRDACVSCCYGTVKEYKANIPACKDLCKKYSDLPKPKANTKQPPKPPASKPKTP